MRAISFISLLAVALAHALACSGVDASSGGDTSDLGATDDMVETSSDVGDGSSEAADAGQDAAGEGVTPPLAPTTPFPWTPESDDASCGNGVDDDGNGYTDCDDFACSRNLAVSVCPGGYENSPEECADGVDSDGDALTDCEDPDCAENPFHEVCPPEAPETGCLSGVDEDGDGLTGCEDTDCLWLDPTCPGAARLRVLFDQTLDETAAAGPNSDWILDASGALPFPSDPASAEAWSGALSSFGYDLLRSHRYLVASLPSWGGRLSYGDDTNPWDLAQIDVLVLVEPSRGMTDVEKAALIRFVDDGGGLLLLSNHVGADRDGNGWSAPLVLQDWFDANPVRPDPFGLAFDPVDEDPGKPLSLVAHADHPVMDGPHGQVDSVGFFNGCTAHLTGSNDSALGLIFLDDAPDEAHGVAVGAVEVGLGRVVFATDSAILGDGSDSHGNVKPYKDAYNEITRDNRSLFLNAMDWLSER